VKISLDPRDSKESNAYDKNKPLHFKFYSKIHICAFAVQIFDKITRKSKTRFLHPFCLSDTFLAINDRQSTQQQDAFEKSGIWPFWGGKSGGPSVSQKN